MIWFGIVLDILSLSSLCILHISFICHLTKVRQKVRYYVLYSIGLCLLQLLSVQFHMNWFLSIFTEVLLLYGISLYALGNQRASSFTASVLAVYISQLSSGIINSAEVLILPFWIGTPALYGIVLFTVFLSFLLCSCCYALVLRFLSFQEHTFQPYIWILLCCGLFFLGTELYIIQTAYNTLPTIEEPVPVRHLALFFLQALGLFALLCMLYAYQRTCLSLQTQSALLSLTQAAKAQKTYITEAQMRYETTQAFRHDIKNHLSVLNGLLRADKIEEAKNYLQKIETTAASLSFSCQTSNPVVDVLLSEKLESAGLHNIETEVSLILPRTCNVDDFDLCVIFANALDNAIEACLSVEEHPSLSLQGEQQGDFYRLEFRNTCSPGPLPPMGTGLTNIKAAAEKYHGTMLMEKTTHTFCLHVLINIS